LVDGREEGGELSRSWLVDGRRRRSRSRSW
jgi:hypothetical protein